MIEYEEEYYIKLNPERTRWELWFWKGVGRLVYYWSYGEKSAFNFKEAKKIILKIKESIEKEPYQKEWEYGNEIPSQ